MADAVDLGLAVHRLPRHLRLALEKAARGHRARQKGEARCRFRLGRSVRYNPQASPAGATAGAGAGTQAIRSKPTPSTEPVRASAPAEGISESRSEVIGVTDDGTTETIAIHEVDIDGDTESIVRIEDDAGSVETLVTGSPVEEIDLANLGESAATEEPLTDDVPEVEIIEIDEIVVAELGIETQADVEVAELIETSSGRSRRRRKPKPSQHRLNESELPERSRRPRRSPNRSKPPTRISITIWSSTQTGYAVTGLMTARIAIRSRRKPAR